MNYLTVLFAAESSSAPFFLLVIIGGIVLCGLMYLAAATLDKYDKNPNRLRAIECLKTQAGKRGGVMKDAAYENIPKLIFLHDDREFTVSLRQGGKSMPNATFVTFQTDWFPDANFRMTSKKFKALISFSKIKNFYDIVSEKYEVEGSNSALVRAVLTEEIQNDLLSYEEATEIRFGDCTGVHYALKPFPGRFYLTSDKFKVEDADYDRLIETTVKFYERLKLLAARNVIEI